MKNPSSVISCVFVAFSLISTQTYADDENRRGNLPIYFQCYLPTSPVSCAILIQRLTSGGPYTSVDDPANARVNVQIGEMPIDQGGLQFQFRMTGTGPGGSPRVDFSDSVPRTSFPTLDARLITDLHQTLAPYQVLLSPGELREDGTWILTFGNSNHTPPQGAANTGNSGWYARPNAGAHISQGSLFEMTVTGGAIANYSNERWRFTMGGGATYQRIRIPSPGHPDQEAEVFSIGGRTLTAYTIHGGWSVAAIVMAEHSPQENENFTTTGQIGFEWILVPFIQVNQRTIAVRYTVGAGYTEFSRPNFQNWLDAPFFTQMAELYFAWRFGERFTIQASGNVYSLMTHADWDDLIRYLQFSGSTSITWFLTDRFTIQASFSIAHRNQILAQPRRMDSNPAFLLAGGGNFGALNYNGGLTFSYTFGNAWSYRRDQRWISSGQQHSH